VGDILSLLLLFLGVSALLPQWVLIIFRSLAIFSSSGFVVLADDAVLFLGVYNLLLLWVCSLNR
jgi:hypothetical protein